MYCSSASIFKELQCRSKLVIMLSKNQTAWFHSELLGISSKSKLFAYGIIVIIGGIRVKSSLIGLFYHQTILTTCWNFGFLPLHNVVQNKQTVQTQIRGLLQEPSNLCLYCLPTVTSSVIKTSLCCRMGGQNIV